MANWKSKWLRSRAAGSAAGNPPTDRGRSLPSVFVLLVVAFVAMGVGWRTPPAWACACSSDPDFEKLIDTAGAVFVGEPIALDRTFTTPFGDAELWDFSVERVYAGPDTARIAVGGAAAGDSCHVDLSEYGRVGIIARWRSGHLSVGLCGIVNADELMAALGDGEAPVEVQAIAATDDDPIGAVTGPDSNPVSESRSPTTVLVGGGVLLAAALAGGVLMRRRRTAETPSHDVHSHD